MLILVRRAAHDMSRGQFELMQIKVQVHDSGERSLTTMTTASSTFSKEAEASSYTTTTATTT